jgi:four helix bundle protein
MENKNLILEMSLNFALAIIEYSELLEEKHKFVVAKQLLRSGTSIGANIHEAQSAESKVDFIHKFKISDKEACETIYWLKLCQLSKSYPSPPDSLFDNLNSIKNIISKIIISSKKQQ